MEDLISVIIPVYNVENYIDVCVDSVVTQTYDKLEIIIVNDGSTDGSREKCIAWSKKDKRIKVVEQNNRGLSVARNKGLSICHGEWIIFVDSDDVLPENAVNILYNMVDLKRDVKVAQGNKTIFAGITVNDMHFSYKVFTGKMFLKSHYFSTTACGKIYHRSVWSHRRFREGIIHEDYDIMYKIVYEMPYVAFTETVVYLVRKRDGSITRSPFSEKKMVLLEIDEQKIAYFRERKEKVLLEQAYLSYYSNLLHLYKLSRDKEIVKKYRENYKYFISLHSIKLKTKIKLMLCYLYPGLWEWKRDIE